jgi:hypothetical protein
MRPRTALAWLEVACEHLRRRRRHKKCITEKPDRQDPCATIRVLPGHHDKLTVVLAIDYTHE